MIVATNNEGKLKEIKNIFKEYKLYSLKEKNILIDVEEDCNTFLGNATKKAKEIYDLVNEEVISDDSGLCIDILNDWPGVLTHRFLGENTTKEERNLAILDRMKDYSGDERKAKVVCKIVYYDGEDILVGEGILNGRISKEIRGVNGFGFDQIFELENGKTLGELIEKEKNKISARYLALMDLKNKLSKFDKKRTL